MQPPRRAGLSGFFSTIPSHVWVPIIVTYACLLPREMTVDLAGAALFPYRACLFIFLPYAIGQAITNVPRLSVIDFFAAITAIWHVVALLMTESISVAFIRGGAQAADFGFAYLIGRATLRTPSDLRIYFLAVLPGLTATALIMVAESLSGRLILRPLVAELFGRPRPTNTYERVRLGLFRASGPFPHPILGGVFLAAILPLAWYLPKSRLVKMIAVITAMCCLFTVSSTALLALALCGGIMGMRWVQKITRLPVFATTIAYIVMAYIAVSSVSQSGAISVASRYLLFESGSSYYRQLIWEYAGAEALNHPIFGIGLRDWDRLDWMIDSIDSFWLSSAMRFGFPMAVGAFLTIAGTVVLLVARCSRGPLSVRDTAFAIGTSLGVIIFSGFTVHLWEGVAGWMLLITGASVTLSQWQAMIAPRRPLMRPPPPRMPHPSHAQARRPLPVPQARGPR
jgi:O-antigen ligase